MLDDLVRGVKCPKCKRETVVYNGNYFCDNEDCDWVMSENARGRARALHKNIIRTYLTQRHEEALAAGRTEEAERMNLYLTNL